MSNKRKRPIRRSRATVAKAGPATSARTSAASKDGGSGQRAASPWRGLSSNVKLTLGAVAVAVVVITVALLTGGNGGPAGPVDAGKLVRADSHRLSTAADGKVTVVEFLDFECEACGAAFPGVEQLRAEYDGRITYVVRYFPLPGHLNAENAARAVQAAANQDQFEAMYVKMFQTQSTWGDQGVGHTATFEGFATEIGLDLDRYRADVASPATAARVAADKQDGLDLGVNATPTFFINGTKFTGRPTYEGLKAAVDDALNA